MAEISFACPSCNQTLEAPEDMAGQVVECPSCQQQMTIPGEVAPAEEEMAAAEVVEAPAPSGKKCPECDADMDEDSVLCMHCGFHLKLGKKISTSLK